MQTRVRVAIERVGLGSAGARNLPTPKTHRRETVCSTSEDPSGRRCPRIGLDIAIPRLPAAGRLAPGPRISAGGLSERPDGGVWRGMRLAPILALGLVLAHMEVGRAQKALLGGAFKVCSRSDPQLERCILDSLNGARDKLANGIPELGIVPLEALRGLQLNMHEGEEEFNFQLTFNNCTWSGLSDFVAIKARLRFSPPYLELVTTIKNMTITGTYQFRGTILTLRINGNGDAVVNWGADVTHNLRLEEEKRGGEVFWRVADYSWKGNIAHFRCNFKNLFRGNKRLGNYANQFINRNWKAAYTVYGPVIDGALANAIKENMIDPLLARVPASRLFFP